MVQMKSTLPELIRRRGWQSVLPFFLFALTIYLLPNDYVSRLTQNDLVAAVLGFWPKIAETAEWITSRSDAAMGSRYIVYNLLCMALFPIIAIIACSLVLQQVRLEWKPSAARSLSDRASMHPAMAFVRAAVVFVVLLSFFFDLDGQSVFQEVASDSDTGVPRRGRFRWILEFLERPEMILFWYGVWYGVMVEIIRQLFAQMKTIYVD
jgi:hypothetical protein